MDMLKWLAEQLQEQLLAAGAIVNLLVRHERSLFDDHEQEEVTLVFAESEESEEGPTATIHLFPLDETTCEIEVELAYLNRAESGADLWRRARKIVAEVSYTEKRRFLSPDQPAESSLTLDYHFVVTQPRTEAEASELIGRLRRFSADLAALVRL